MKPFVKRADLWLILALLCVCGLLFVPRLARQESSKAVISCKGEILCEIDLSHVEAAYAIPLATDPKAVLQVEPGTVYFLEADCPDQLCVKSGRLTKPGDTAACLPARVVVTIEGAWSKGTADIMTY